MFLKAVLQNLDNQFVYRLDRVSVIENVLVFILDTLTKRALN